MVYKGLGTVPVLGIQCGSWNGSRLDKGRWLCKCIIMINIFGFLNDFYFLKWSLCLLGFSKYFMQAAFVRIFYSLWFFLLLVTMCCLLPLIIEYLNIEMLFFDLLIVVWRFLFVFNHGDDCLLPGNITFFLI